MKDFRNDNSTHTHQLANTTFLQLVSLTESAFSSLSTFVVPPHVTSSADLISAHMTIERRAYFIWQEADSSEFGNDIGNWLKAEREISEEFEIATFKC